MQSRRRSRRAAGLPGVYCLIPFWIGQLRFDIWRQRHLSQPLQYLEEQTIIPEMDDPVAAIRHLFHNACQLSVTEADFCSGAHLFSRTAQTLPAAAAKISEQDDLDSASRGPDAEKTRRDHSGVVQDQAVTGLKVGRQIIEISVLYPRCGPVKHEKT